MESITELKKIVRKSQVNYKSPWYARKVIRKISIYITRLFLHTNITANQVTILQLIVSVIGIGLLCSGNSWISFAGVFLLHLGYVFDCVDGEYCEVTEPGGCVNSDWWWKNVGNKHDCEPDPNICKCVNNRCVKK